MADTPDLKLNGPDRYAKTSPRFVLESHSHCEVPAGCGGVVLRWRNPVTATPLTLWTYGNQEADLLLDGAQPSSARPLVPHGEHVFALRFPAGPVAFLLAALYDETPGEYGNRPDRGPKLSRPTSQRFNVVSAPDGAWRFSRAAPPADWARVGFDDSAWETLGAVAEPVAKPDDYPAEWQLRQVRERGARAIGVDVTGPVWVRRRFTLAAPGEARA